MLNCDNQGEIALSKDNKFHARTKHIDLHYHFIREAVQDDKITVKYVPMDESVADIFPKPLPRPKFIWFVEMLGLKEIMVGKSWWCRLDDPTHTEGKEVVDVQWMIQNMNDVVGGVKKKKEKKTIKNPFITHEEQSLITHLT
jgi:hypothetical protein